MLEIISHNPNIDFKGKFKLGGIISVLGIIISFALIIFKGFNYGVDFRGGAEIQLQFTKEVNLDKLRDVLSSQGFRTPSVQSIGNPEDKEFLIKVPASAENLNTTIQQISDSIKKELGGEGLEIRKTDIVGPKAGEELRTAGFKAMLYSLIAIMIYVALRFDFRYAPGTVLSLFHDIMFVLGIWSLLGIEFSLQTVAAILTVVGYSVNDTVVIYDRVRENEEKNSELKLVDILNNAINETLSRTIWTAGATLMTSLAMFFWGGATIKDFFFAMSIGIVVGTYSSIFIATPTTLFLDHIKRARAKAVTA